LLPEKKTDFPGIAGIVARFPPGRRISTGFQSDFRYIFTGLLTDCRHISAGNPAEKGLYHKGLNHAGRT
jgi:hypothetical protein